jgi:hypothetical protein
MPDPNARWEIKNDKWVEKLGGGYRVKDKKEPPRDIPEIRDWILDMIDWGQMLLEDVTKLRGEVRTLSQEVARNTQSIEEISSLREEINSLKTQGARRT